jgi:predicted double-glycine peptidase
MGRNAIDDWVDLLGNRHMQRSRKSLVSVVAALLTAAGVLWGISPRPADAGELTLYGGDGAYHVPLTTFQELKYRTVIRQKYDFSCGSAALATLLSYHYQIPTKETAVFSDMWEHGDKRKIEQDGFSMLDMQQYLARVGLQSNGYRSTLARVIQADVPGLVLLNLGGYMHFVVLEGVKDGRVLIADPALGTRALSTADFEKDWNGIFFVVLNDPQKARATFNRDTDWAAQPRGPLGLAQNGANLSNMLLSLHGSNVF